MHPRRASHSHYVPPATDLGGGTLRVFLGELAGARSPVPTFTPLLGAELVLDARTSLTFDIDPGFEHGVLVDTGAIAMCGTELHRTDLGYVGVGARELTLRNDAEAPARVIVLGGAPFGEQIVMWWNFVARSHDEIVELRDAWQAESEQFGRIDGEAVPSRLPAPELPHVRLRPRANPAPPH